MTKKQKTAENDFENGLVSTFWSRGKERQFKVAGAGLYKQPDKQTTGKITPRNIFAAFDSKFLFYLEQTKQYSSNGEFGEFYLFVPYALSRRKASTKLDICFYGAKLLNGFTKIWEFLKITTIFCNLFRVLHRF